jgi:hypothetical protein
MHFVFKLVQGLIHHFCNDPQPLELSMDPKVFNLEDDSREKLTVETFFLVTTFIKKFVLTLHTFET